ncbi:MAG TPA: MFS transporter [Vicinamibacterales bacterium]|nr:MFS transporter [Vicinamibacterales bacterium]
MTALARVRRRLIPFLFLLYLVAYLDRVNVGLAALQMNAALGFSARVYGFGAGIFFVSYVLFEVPSNLVLERVGVRVWIARIMITWGLVSAAMVFVRDARSFFVLRFALGAAEAGFFPGIILYLTRWFPAPDRARAVALFMTATALAGVIGGPLSGALLTMNGVWGLQGWQWLFLLEGLPAVALGFVVLYWLPERPSDAQWLTNEDRVALEAAIASDRARVAPTAHHALGPAMRSTRVWLLAFLYFTIVISFYAISFWLPQILRSFSSGSDLTIGVISAVPYVCAAMGMVATAAISDRSGERAGYVAIAALVGAAGFCAAAVLHDPVASFAGICVAALGLWSTMGPFWTLPSRFLAGPAAAGGIALINSVGNTGGFVGPYVMGYVRDHTGSFSAGMLVMGASLVGTAALAMVARRTE